MEKSLLMILREEDALVKECERIESAIHVWNELSNSVSAHYDSSRFTYRAEACLLELNFAKEELADKRRELRRRLIDIIQAETV